MPIYRLSSQLIFPPPRLAEADGLLAVGGDLTLPRLLLAYTSGIFPWFNPEDPILWWSPDPRCIIEPAGLHLSRSLQHTLRRNELTVSCDRAFGQVIKACAEVRLREGEGTWLGTEMIGAYQRLYELGYAHSVECWRDGELVGGLYGVCLGHCFFGESMFHRAPDASKVALAWLCQQLQECDFELIDCQVANPHLLRLGAKEIPRSEFLQRLRGAGVTPMDCPPPGAFPAWSM